MRKKKPSKGIKTPRERANSVRRIKNAQSEPTYDEDLNFDESDSQELRDEYDYEKKNIRRVSWQTKAKRHVGENLIAYIISGVLGAIWLFAFILNSEISTNTTNISNNGEKIEQNRDDINSIKDTNNEQEVDIQVNKSKIESLENDKDRSEQNSQQQ